MPFPIRENDDEATLYTDDSVDQTAAYQRAEKDFDPAHPESAQPRDDGTAPGYQHKKGGAGGGAVSGDEQSHQQETSTSEDPSQAAHDADPRDI